MGNCQTDNCVYNKVRDIIVAQDNATNRNNGCATGCDQSIQYLLLPSTNGPSRNITIPFFLYCKGDCYLFNGEGVSQDPLTAV